MDKLDSKYLVYTNYDTKADFKAFETYYLPDSILVIGNSKDAEYWKDESAQEILSAYVANMDNRGYVRIDNREDADLGLQVSYVKSTYYFTDYGRPEWWWNYPGYWDAPYWGNWGGWYYPYAVNYAYSTGSFITELLNLDAPQGEKEKTSRAVDQLHERVIERLDLFQHQDGSGRREPGFYTICLS